MGGAWNWHQKTFDDLWLQQLYEGIVVASCSTMHRNETAFTGTTAGPVQRLQSIRKIIDFWYTVGWKWWVISFCDYLGFLNVCSYDVDVAIGPTTDQFGFQNFCSPVVHILQTKKVFKGNSLVLLRIYPSAFGMFSKNHKFSCSVLISIRYFLT